TREDANSESALLAEWLVEDRAAVRKGQPVCVVETSKASVELEAEGDGTLVQLVSAGLEVELGSSIGLIAQSDRDLEAAATRLSAAPSEPAGDEGPGNVTRKAAERAAELGVDVSRIRKAGFVTAQDVETFAASAREPTGPAETDVLLDGLSMENVTLPAIFSVATEDAGVLDAEFLAGLRADPAAFGALSSEERCDAYRRHGASIGEGVVLGAGTTIVAPRIVLEDGVEIGAHGIVRCEEVFAAGEIAWFGESLKLTCRRAFIGAGTWIAAHVQVGGGGHRDPWATFVIGELGFMGGEAFVNVCRPVVIGAEVFLTMRSVLLTHNVGHSVLEGFENRFAGVVLEDRAQVGVGAVVYAGCRIGREAIVVSNSYVVNDVHEGTLVGGVPARPIGHAKRPPARPRQVELARRIVNELEEVLRLSGVETAPLADGRRGFELTGREGPGRVVFSETVAEGFSIPGGEGETVVLTLEARGAAPEGCAVLDLLGRRVHAAEDGVLLDSVREFCRKRGVRFEPGPWRYAGGLV
ncbi:MAG TPA: biotin/lipoyl-containing protein, partial [Gaiella sp.]|nr:biotin/lipoyl-containing protein [Gaiella sp.]